MSSKDNNTKHAISSRKTINSTKSQSRSQSSSSTTTPPKHVSSSSTSGAKKDDNITKSSSSSVITSSMKHNLVNNSKKRNNSSKQQKSNDNETNQRPSTSKSGLISNSKTTTTSTKARKPTSFMGKTNNEKVLVELVTKEDSINSSEMATTNETNIKSKEDVLVEIETDIDRDDDDDDVDENEQSEKSNLLSDNSTSTITPTVTNCNNNNKQNSSQNKRNNNNNIKLDEMQQHQELPNGWEQHRDKNGLYFWHISSGVIQRSRPSLDVNPSKDSVLICHDDEEINVNGSLNNFRKGSFDLSTIDGDDGEDEFYDLSGAALTIDDTTTTTTTAAASTTSTIMNDETTNSFVVYPLGCCEFDETQLVSTTSTKLIQKCILKLSNRPTVEEEIVCWGLTQAHPVLLRLFDDYIQFTDITSKTLLRNQPIQTIKTWAVDDDNNFAFVIEDRPEQLSLGATNLKQTKIEEEYYSDNLDYELLNEPTLICYVFHSMDDDDMSCKVASKLNEQINRYKEQLSNRIIKSTRVQQMRVEQKPLSATIFDKEATDVEEDFNDNDNDEDDNELEANNEMTMNVKYIGKTPVPRPVGIEVLNVAIDKCLAEASKAQINRTLAMQQQKQPDDDNNGQQSTSQLEEHLEEPLIEAKLHVSPSSVIVENTCTGEIIVECRIRFLTFMGISKRDIRWCGFIMQNSTNKSFVAHCFECYPTAGHVCEAIQLSCTKMYEKVVKNSAMRHHEPDEPEAISIIPSKSKIRNTLAKTLLRIRLNPLVSNLP